MTFLARALPIVACLSAGCDLPGRPDAADRPLRADEIVDFDFLFQRNCTGCHGVAGKLGPAPPLNDPLFLTIVPDDELLRVIARGRPGTPMAAFAQEHGGPLSAAQVKALARGLKPRFRSPVEAKEPLPPYRTGTSRSGPPSAEDVSRGAELFARACAGCHGKRGEGADAGALADPAFLSLTSDQVLRRLVITGRPDLGMPHFANRSGREDDFRPLTSAEIDDIVAFLASWRQTSPAELLGPDHSNEGDHGR